jgi:predicted lipoprotein
MKANKNALPWITVALFIVLIVATCRVTIVQDQKPKTLINKAGETVEMAELTVTEQYTFDNWDTKIIPTIKKRAVDMSVLLEVANTDLNSAGAQYGSRANETSAWSFCVQGTGRVLEIENADKPNRTNILIDAPPYDGKVDYKIHYGKVFPSNIKNSIRDGVGFLKLDDFANQVEFADLTTAFNKKVRDELILTRDVQEYEGKMISFSGCISLHDTKPESLVILPVVLEIVEE